MLKQKIRQLYMEKRKSLSEVERAQFSKEIAAKLISEFDLDKKKISIFLPIIRLLEVNTWEIINNANTKFILPVVQGDKLNHFEYESDEQLRVSDWGIPEPQYGKATQPEELDVVLVPLLACDKEGNRVGYGKGFYDGFLQQCNENCLLVGLSYFDPIAEISDVHTEDLPLQFCITPKAVYKF